MLRGAFSLLCPALRFVLTVTQSQGFVDCLFNKASGALTNPGNTNQTCLLGSACQKAPDGSANPYAGVGRRGRRWVRLASLHKEARRMMGRSTAPAVKTYLLEARRRGKGGAVKKVGPLKWNARIYGAGSH